MLACDPDTLMEAALALRRADPAAPARHLLDAVMLGTEGKRIPAGSGEQAPLAWLGPRTAWAHLLREAFAPEVAPDDLQLLDDPDPEVREVFGELWQRSVVKRFGRCYLGW